MTIEKLSLAKRDIIQVIRVELERLSSLLLCSFCTLFSSSFSQLNNLLLRTNFRVFSSSANHSLRTPRLSPMLGQIDDQKSIGGCVVVITDLSLHQGHVIIVIKDMSSSSSRTCHRRHQGRVLVVMKDMSLSSLRTCHHCY